MLTLWHLWRGGGMAPGPLPQAGGAGDQAAIMLDAFGVMSATQAWLDGLKGNRR